MGTAASLNHTATRRGMSNNNPRRFSNNFRPDTISIFFDLLAEILRTIYSPTVAFCTFDLTRALKPRRKKNLLTCARRTLYPKKKRLETNLQSSEPARYPMSRLSIFFKITPLLHAGSPRDFTVLVFSLLVSTLLTRSRRRKCGVDWRRRPGGGLRACILRLSESHGHFTTHQ